jgi:hypothetical protein
MAFAVQDDDATVDNANSYESVEAFRTWASDMGIDSAGFLDAEVQVALVKATRYLDAKYGSRYVGYQLRRLQGTLFPRGGTRSFLRGLPPALRLAACSLTNRSLAGIELMPDPTFDASGQQVIEQTDKVGPLESTVKYSEGHGLKAREYPEVTLMLSAAGIIGSANSGQLVRG